MVARHPIAILLLLAPLVAGSQPSRAEPTGAETSSPEPRSEVAAWKALCSELERAGSEILERYPQAHEVDRAEGPLYLAQQLSLAIRQTLAARDRSFPLLRLGANDLYKAGFDGADAKYQGAPIEGNGTYRLHGSLGNARLIDNVRV